MLVRPNVKQVLDPELEQRVWSIIQNDLVEGNKIRLFESSDMAILANFISISGASTEEFWHCMTDRFQSLQTEMTLKDFMMICKAFK